MICLVIIGICLFIQIGFLIYTCYSFYKCSEDIEGKTSRNGNKNRILIYNFLEQLSVIAPKRIICQLII